MILLIVFNKWSHLYRGSSYALFELIKILGKILRAIDILGAPQNNLGVARMAIASSINLHQMGIQWVYLKTIGFNFPLVRDRHEGKMAIAPLYSALMKFND